MNVIVLQINDFDFSEGSISIFCIPTEDEWERVKAYQVESAVARLRSPSYVIFDVGSSPLATAIMTTDANSISPNSHDNDGALSWLQLAQ